MEHKIDIGRYLKYQKTLGDLYTKMIEQAASQVGLTKPEADVRLFFANHREYTTAADAVRMRGLSKGYVSKAVDGLSGKGLIQIRVGSGDRRFQHITVEPCAGEAAAKLQAVQKEYIRILVKGFTADEKEQLMELLGRMSRNCQITVKNK